MTMVSLPVYDRAGQEVGELRDRPAELAARISKQLLHEVVVMYQANLRQGTFQTKARGEVAGSTKKMYRQKGTGNARAGSRRSPIRRGGGHAFAKRPRDFGYRLPKQAVRVATRMALASRIADQEVKLIDELSFAEPKTQGHGDDSQGLEAGGQAASGGGGGARRRTCTRASATCDGVVGPAGGGPERPGGAPAQGRA